MLPLLFVALLYFPAAGGQYQRCSQYGPPERVLVSRGTVESPNHPGNYPNNAYCEWLVILPETQGVVDARFRRFDLEYCFTCECDNVTLYNGSSQSDPLIGTYCGAGIPAPFTTTSNQLFIEFQTDFISTYTGFQLVFETRETACDSQVRAITAAPGQIQTRFFPYFNYDNSLNCQWRLIAPINQIVSVYLESFHTEPCCDFLYIYDGVDNLSPLLAMLSGGWSGYQYFSTQSAMFLQLTTDSFYTSTGFRLHFDFMSDPTSSTPPTGGNVTMWIPLTETPDYGESTATEGHATGTVGESHTTGWWPDSTVGYQESVAPSEESITSTPAVPATNIPVLELNLNGTFRTADYSRINDADCESPYVGELRNTANQMLIRVNEKIYSGNMCNDTGNISVEAIDVSLAVLQEWGFPFFFVFIGDISKQYSFNDANACGLEIRQYMEVHANWPQPILRQPPFCPDVVWEPQAFQGNTSRWGCFTG